MVVGNMFGYMDLVVGAELRASAELLTITGVVIL